MESSKFRKHASMADSRRTVLSILGETTVPASPAPRTPLEPPNAPVDTLPDSPVSKVPVRCRSGRGSRAFSKRPRSSFLPSTGVAIHLLLCRGRGGDFEMPPTSSPSLCIPILGGRECGTFSGGGGRCSAASCGPLAAGLVAWGATWGCLCDCRQGFSRRSWAGSLANFFLACSPERVDSPFSSN